MTQHAHGRGDVEVGERLAVAGAREALLEQRAELGDVLGREQRRDPAVGDLGRQRRVLRPDRGDVDRDPLLHGRDRELERLARARRAAAAASVSPWYSTRSRAQRHPHDVDVLARALELAAEALRRASPRRPAGRWCRCRAGSARRRAGRASRRSSPSSPPTGPGICMIAEPSRIRSRLRRRARRGSSRRPSRRPRPSRPSRSRAARPPGRARAAPPPAGPRPQ